MATNDSVHHHHAESALSQQHTRHLHFIHDHKRKPIGEVHQHHIDDFYPLPDDDPTDNIEILQAREHASEPDTPLGEAGQQLRRVIFGKPISEHMAALERLNPVRALAILSSDALSSVAYGTEASLAVLLAAGVGALRINVWIGLAIALLMIIVGNSYRQTIFAYPRGGGSYTVARQNLGTLPGLIAAGALLVDYLLTVAVSVAAGIDAIATAFPALTPYRVPLDVAAILIIMAVNLRGVREAGSVFAVPTYLFLGSFGLMIIVGIIRAAFSSGGLLHAAPVVSSYGGSSPLTLMLILTAFASGCSAMTGVEAISNSVPVFTGKDEQEQSRNAARTLVVMIAILVCFFLGTTYLAWRLGIAPNPLSNPTVTGSIAAFTFDHSILFYLVQIATLLILVFAANTSFAGFPRLTSILAQDDFLPRFFEYRGERLAFNTGIIVLGALSIAVLVAFRGNVDNLINLYALGVFTAFTLSQTGMVRHWQKARNVTNKAWRMFANGLGAVITAIVTVVIATAKFDRGAWVVLILVPLLVLMFLGIRRYYTRPRVYHFDQVPPIKADMAIVPIITPRDLREVLNFARSVVPHVIAVRVVNDPAEGERFRRKWEQTIGKVIKQQHWPVQLEIVLEPYRTVVLPLARFAEWHAEHFPNERIVVLLPRQQNAAWWEFPLHRRIARRVRAALLREKDHLRLDVVDLPYSLGPMVKKSGRGDDT